jgi:hypothetical protein
MRHRVMATGMKLNKSYRSILNEESENTIQKLNHLKFILIGK